MSFLFVDTERVWRGGQDQLLSLLRGLHERGHSIHLVCHPGSILEDRVRDSGITVHSLAIPREIGLIPYLRLRRIILEGRPEILAFNTPRAILLGSLASRRTSVRARLIFRRVSFPLHRNLVTRLKYSWGIDCIVAISDSIRRQLLAGGVPGRLVHTIYEGLDLSLFPLRPPGEVLHALRTAVVGTVASLSPEKGLSNLVEAAALLPYPGTRVRFIIVGEGECRPDLEALVRARDLADAFEFKGFQAETLKCLYGFDLFVLPSLSEGLSSAILAAMAASLPVIATNVGGIPELVRHGHNGLLVPPGDPNSLAKAIQFLCDNPQEAREMGRRGRLRAEEEFTLARKILQTEALCSSLLQKPAPTTGAADA